MFALISLRNNVGTMRIDFDGVKPWSAGIVGTRSEDSASKLGIVGQEVVWADSSERTIFLVDGYKDVGRVACRMRGSCKAIFAYTLPTVVLGIDSDAQSVQ